MERAAIALGVVLCACGGGSGVEDPDASAVDAAPPCTMGNSDPSLPDIVTQPVFTPPVAVPGNTITGAVTVDGDTKYVSVAMLSVDRTVIAGGTDRVTDGDVTVTLEFETMPSAPTGDYFFSINVCSSRDACVTEERGVSYSPLGTPVVAETPLTRTDYDGAIELGVQETCYQASLVTLSN